MTPTFRLLPATLGIEPSAWPLYERLKIGALRNIDIQKETGLLHYSRRFTSIRQAPNLLAGIITYATVAIRFLNIT
jgi:hypothetical protein